MIVNIIDQILGLQRRLYFRPIEKLKSTTVSEKT